MELKEFVKTVLKDIIEAVDESREEIKGGEICPAIPSAYQYEWGKNFSYQPRANRYYQNLEFDIAVTTENMMQGGGKAKVSVMGLVEVGGDGGKAVTNTNVSKIKFSVPFAFNAKKLIEG